MDLNGKPPGSDPSEGNLTIPLTLTSATYKAPHTVPKVNPVAVAIAVLPQGPIKNKITLICNVTVVDRTNAFSVTGPKTAFGVYYLDDRYSSAQVQSMLARAYMAGPELAVTVSAMQPGGAGGGEQYHGTGMMSLRQRQRHWRPQMGVAHNWWHIRTGRNDRDADHHHERR